MAVQRFDRAFEVDTRSLAVLRIALGLGLVLDVILRARNFGFFYTDRGVIPMEVVRDLSPDYTYTLHYVSSDPVFVAVFFLLSAVVGIQLAIGYKTRTATFLALVLVISLDHANPFVLSVADGLFRLLLFWALFLPLGERWSVDALHTDSAPRDSMSSIGSALILLQMVAMYLINGLHKVRGGEWWYGEAAVLMIGRDEMTFLLGDYLREVPMLVQFGGMLWFYMLLFSWTLLVLEGRKRYILAVFFAGVHLQMALSLRVGALLWIAMAGLFLFCQREFWTDLYAAARRLGWMDRLDDARARFVRLGSGLPYPRVHEERQRQLKPVAHSLVLFLFAMAVILVAVNILAVQVLLTPAALLTDAEVDRVQAVESTVENSVWLQPVVATANKIGLTQQDWRMFATAANMDKYYVYPAETADGELLDVRNDRELYFDRPYDRLHRQHGTYRERFYRSFLTAVRFTEGEDRLHETKAEYLCERYSDRGHEITHLSMYVVYEEIDRASIDSPEDRNVATMRLYRHGCGDREPREVVEPPIREIDAPADGVLR